MSDTTTGTPPAPESEYCAECDEYVLPIERECPLCGGEIGIPDSETVPAGDSSE